MKDLTQQTMAQDGPEQISYLIWTYFNQEGMEKIERVDHDNNHLYIDQKRDSFLKCL